MRLPKINLHLLSSLLHPVCLFFNKTLWICFQEHPPGQTRNENVPGDASSLSPTSTYALVEFHPKTESTKSKKIPQPETVYAQVTRPTRPRVTAQQTELENISSINSQG